MLQNPTMFGCMLVASRVHMESSHFLHDNYPHTRLSNRRQQSWHITLQRVVHAMCLFRGRSVSTSASQKRVEQVWWTCSENGLCLSNHSTRSCVQKRRANPTLALSFSACSQLVLIPWECTIPSRRQCTPMCCIGSQTKPSSARPSIPY